MKLPYLIYIPDWQRTSAGVRNCHYLAHLLNEHGYPCALIGNKTNPAWKTLCLRENQVAIDAWLDAGAIMIIPDMYEGYPFGARQRVIRYIHHRPGHFTGNPNVQFASHEMVVPFVKMFVKAGQTNAEPLMVYHIEPELFQDIRADRDRACVWRRTPQGIVPITHHWPFDRAQLADLFQKSVILYSFDDWTAMVYEAALCGCPAAIIPATGGFTREEYERSELGLDGIAWGTDDEEIERARTTVQKFPVHFALQMSYVHEHVDRFIQQSQSWYADIDTRRREPVCPLS